MSFLKSYGLYVVCNDLAHSPKLREIRNNASIQPKAILPTNSLDRGGTSFIIRPSRS
jgi:hypothetical protein